MTLGEVGRIEPTIDGARTNSEKNLSFSARLRIYPGHSLPKMGLFVRSRTARRPIARLWGAQNKMNAQMAKKDAKKKGQPEGWPVKFRRGCLKGTPFLHPTALLCKCENDSSQLQYMHLSGLEAAGRNPCFFCCPNCTIEA